MAEEITTLWLDTDIVWSATRLRTIAELARAAKVRVVVSAQTHMESYRQTRALAARDGKPFSVKRFRGILDATDVDVVDVRVDKALAEAWGDILHLRYSSHDAWQAAKLACVKARLPSETTFQAERVPMTTDWLMALEIERQGFYVAVRDEGEEWKALRAMNPKRALTYEETLDWLRVRVSTSALERAEREVVEIALHGR